MYASVRGSEAALVSRRAPLRLVLLGVITLFLWHAAHRLRVTMYDFGLRQDSVVAVVVYLTAAAGTVLTLLYLIKI